MKICNSCKWGWDENELNGQKFAHIMGLYTQKAMRFKFFLLICFQASCIVGPAPSMFHCIYYKHKQQNLRDIRDTRPSHSAQTQKEVPLGTTTFFTFFFKLAKFCSKVKFKIQKWNDLEVCNGHKWGGGKLSKNH